VITLPRAEWLDRALPHDHRADAPVADETLGFVREVVAAQLYEVRVADVCYGPAEPMYDIAVEEVEQYMASGILVHNSSDPNLQNIPIRTELGRRIRRAFVPDKGNVFVAADYSQLELRLLAHITRDPVMLEAFQQGADIHTRTAQLVFGAQTKEELKEKRRFAKIVNFAIAYAVEPFGLSQRVGISRKEAKQVIEDYYKTYKGVRAYMDKVPEEARAQGYVRSMYGRVRPLPTINDRNAQIRARAEREAINMPIQGSSSDIVKLAMLKVDEALRREGLQTRMVMQVHDELLLEGPKKEAERAAAILKREMETAVALDVPLEVEVGTGANWMDVKGA
jgi:DNA polymerase-1